MLLWRHLFVDFRIQWGNLLIWWFSTVITLQYDAELATLGKKESRCTCQEGEYIDMMPELIHLVIKLDIQFCLPGIKLSRNWRKRTNIPKNEYAPDKSTPFQTHSNAWFCLGIYVVKSNLLYHKFHSSLCDNALDTLWTLIWFAVVQMHWMNLDEGSAL